MASKQAWSSAVHDASAADAPHASSLRSWSVFDPEESVMAGAASKSPRVDMVSVAARMEQPARASARNGNAASGA